MNRVARDVFLCATVLFLLSPTSSATPMVLGTFAFTENFGPNDVGLPVGHQFQLGATVDDPGGVPDNIASVTARLLPSGPTTDLPFLDVGSIFTGLYNSITPYAGESGTWEITATDKLGASSSANTGGLTNPLLMPLATNLAASGQPLMPLITWDPVLFDDDVDSTTPDAEADLYRIRLIDSVSGQFFRTAPIFGNSFQVPTGLINPGVTTTIRLEASDVDGVVLQNRSSTFTEFVASEVPVPGPTILIGGGLAVLLSFRRRQRRL